MKWVVFDLGGVLYRIHHDWLNAARALGYERDSFDFGIFQSPPFVAYQRGDTDADTYLQAFAAAMDLSLSEAKRLHDSILIEPYPKSFELVETLKQKGWKTACLSNTNAMHWASLVAPGHFPALHALDYHHLSFQVNLAKPEEAFFRAFEQATGAQPEQIVYFDDVEEYANVATWCGWRGERVSRETPVEEMAEILGIQL